jgi:hypothetical protein
MTLTIETTTTSSMRVKPRRAGRRRLPETALEDLSAAIARQLCTRHSRDASK